MDNFTSNKMLQNLSHSIEEVLLENEDVQRTVVTPNNGNVKVRLENENVSVLLNVFQDSKYTSESFKRFSTEAFSLQLLQNPSTGQFVLKLTLKDIQFQVVFIRVCSDVIHWSMSDNGSSLTKAYNRLQMWKKLFQNNQHKILSTVQIQGLLGELSFIQQMLDKGYDENFVIKSWTGPDLAHQDFTFPAVSVEVKTTQTDTVQISSIEQLSPNMGTELFLYVNLIEQTTQGINLSELVDNIGMRLTKAKAEFYSQLAKIGYFPVDSNEYIADRYQMVGVRNYLVSDGFPALTNMTLPESIVKCKYQLAINNIPSQFLTSLEYLVESITEDMD